MRRSSSWLLIVATAMASVWGCSDDPVTGPEEKGGVITSDQTWTRATSPHLVTRDLSVENGATLTIEAGSEVQIFGGVGITIGSDSKGQSGHLVAVGSPGNPIRFTGLPQLPWSTLRVQYPGDATLAYVTLENGGDNVVFCGATLMIEGDGNYPIKQVASLDSVTVLNSSGTGIYIWRLGGFADGSQNLRVAGSGQTQPDEGYAAILPAVVAGTLPSGDYTGNGIDEILLGVEDDIESDLFLIDPGIPFHVDGFLLPSLEISQASSAAPVPTLTLDEGVVLAFDGEMTLAVGARGLKGALNTNGTSTNPVVLTSAAGSPGAGDWVGVVFDSDPSPATNQMDHVRIEYAGGDSIGGVWSCNKVVDATPDNAAVGILGWQPAASFLTNSTVFESAGHGVLRGWSSDTAGPDFLPTNTFTAVSGCAQTTPRAADGSCPSPPLPCP